MSNPVQAIKSYILTDPTAGTLNVVIEFFPQTSSSQMSAGWRPAGDNTPGWASSGKQLVGTFRHMDPPQPGWLTLVVGFPGTLVGELKFITDSDYSNPRQPKFVIFEPNNGGRLISGTSCTIQEVPVTTNAS